MSADERKKKILEHLSRSSETMKTVSIKKTAKEVTPPPSPIPEPKPIEENSSTSKAISKSSPETPAAQAESRKRAIMNHLARSNGNFGELSLDSKQRKQKIQEHLRKSLN